MLDFENRSISVVVDGTLPNFSDLWPWNKRYNHTTNATYRCYCNSSGGGGGVRDIRHNIIIYRRAPPALSRTTHTKMSSTVTSHLDTFLQCYDQRTPKGDSDNDVAAADGDYDASERMTERRKCYLRSPLIVEWECRRRRRCRRRCLPLP